MYSFYICKTSMMSEIINGIHISKYMHQVKFSSYPPVSLFNVLNPHEKCTEVLPTFVGVLVVQKVFA